ncbi:MAG: DoxX family protein [Paracoccaceae bacterium]|nr:DoxX family protein [Paracoccaceae bacterium]
MEKIQSKIIILITVLLTLAFGAAGIAKIMGAEMMVATFDAVGVGQWFRYVTGIIEVGGALLLWVNGHQAIGAGLLTCTMIGAVVAHIFVIGPSAMPAAVLGVLSSYILFKHKDQVL